MLPILGDTFLLCSSLLSISLRIPWDRLLHLLAVFFDSALVGLILDGVNTTPDCDIHVVFPFCAPLGASAFLRGVH